MTRTSAQEIAKQLSLKPNAADRAHLVRLWLDTDPDAEDVAWLYKEYSNRDKGVARQLKERQENMKRLRQQAALAVEWAAKAQAMLQQQRLAIADILAWQRDTARLGAPLSQEPLAGLRTALQARLLGVEDLHTQIQVHKEAAVLLAQRIEMQANRSWEQVQEIYTTLQNDVHAWQAKAAEMQGHALWHSVELRMEPMLQNAQDQLLAVWQACSAAYDSAVQASQNNLAPLPSVPAWAADIEAQRVGALQEDLAQKKQLSTEQRQALKAELKARREQGMAVVQPLLQKLEEELSLGHGKASIEAAHKLREALRTHESALDTAVTTHVHSALAAAGELGDWQRWRADQIRAELIQKAVKLRRKPLAPTKQQEQLRILRENWKTTDQGGVPNHSLWRQFDAACTEAHGVVEAWLEQQKTLEAQHRAEREALIAEITAFAAEQAQSSDYKALLRAEHQFAQRWRESGHVAEKAWGPLHQAYRSAMELAFAGLGAASKASIELRHHLIDQAMKLSESAQTSVDQVRALQEQWKNEAQRMPLERQQEQKLWDQFRQALDAVFAKKDEARKQQRAAQNAAEKPALDAVAALEAAMSKDDAAAIQQALQLLEAVLQGRAGALAVAEVAASNPVADGAAVAATTDRDDASHPAPAEAACATDEAPDSQSPGQQASTSGVEAGADADTTPSPATTVAATPAPRKVVAVRGDDRPQAQNAASALLAGGRASAGSKFPAKVGRGDKRDENRDGKRGDKREGNREDKRANKGDARDVRMTAKPSEYERSERIRLSNATFDAVRIARERAQKQLRKMAAQAHGASMMQVLQAWQQRDSTLLPVAAEAGRLAPALALWSKALTQSATDAAVAQEALLRLEIATELPTPAAHQNARRLLQLQMLTQRNSPDPRAWQDYGAQVLRSTHSEEAAARLLAVLKVIAQPR